VKLYLQKGLNFGQTIGFCAITVLQFTRPLPAKKFLAQKSLTEMEHLPYSPNLAPDDFWLFQKIKSALKGQRVQDTEDIQKYVPMTLKTIPQLEFQTYFQLWQH
jgi:hypothetical protein